MTLVTNRVIRALIHEHGLEGAASYLMQNYGYELQAAQECVGSLNVEMV